MQGLQSFRIYPKTLRGVASHLEPEEEGKVFADCESVKEYVVLGADSQAVTDQVHIPQNTVPIDVS